MPLCCNELFCCAFVVREKWEAAWGTSNEWIIKNAYLGYHVLRKKLRNAWLVRLPRVPLFALLRGHIGIVL